jgi:hypothetical protein
MDWAKAQDKLNKMKPVMPPNMTGRRPKRSESGPWMSCDKPKASALKLNESLTTAGVV